MTSFRETHVCGSILESSWYGWRGWIAGASHASCNLVMQSHGCQRETLVVLMCQARCYRTLVVFANGLLLVSTCNRKVLSNANGFCYRVVTGFNPRSDANDFC
ncbi:hypothetical protein ACOSQ3_027022 [Xanthoceras sorbifolium]